MRFSKDTFKFPYNVPTFNLPRSYRRTFLDFTSNQNLSSLSASSNAKQGPLPPKQPSGPPAARSSQDVLKLLFNKHYENEPASPNENASCIAAKSSTDPDGNARCHIECTKCNDKTYTSWIILDLGISLLFGARFQQRNTKIGRKML